MLVFVDDMLITESLSEMVTRTKNDPKNRFEMTNSGKCAFVLGIGLINIQTAA